MLRVLAEMIDHYWSNQSECRVLYLLGIWIRRSTEYRVLRYSDLPVIAATIMLHTQWYIQCLCLVIHVAQYLGKL
jgi:hypothetical protein